METEKLKEIFEQNCLIEAKINSEENRLLCTYYQNLAEMENNIISILQEYPENIRKIVVPMYIKSISEGIDGMVSFAKSSITKELNRLIEE